MRCDAMHSSFLSAFHVSKHLLGKLQWCATKIGLSSRELILFYVKGTES